MSLQHRTQQLASHQVHVSFIIPAYNEEAVIADFIMALDTKAKAIGQPYEIIVVDDASQDNTYAICEALSSKIELKILSFSRNFGKEIALTAGLDHCHGDVAVLIDGDFQHPLDTIPEFLEQWGQGYDMVYGIRKSREDESRIKRSMARFFYRLMAKITQVDIPPNAGDFRLLDRSVIDALKQVKERSRFMKGLYAWVGYKAVAVPFDVKERAGGKSSWSFWRLTELAITGITSFSDIPLRAWGVIGFIISFVSTA